MVYKRLLTLGFTSDAGQPDGPSYDVSLRFVDINTVKCLGTPVVALDYRKRYGRGYKSCLYNFSGGLIRH